LLRDAPFCRYKDRLHFYRIDVIDPGRAEDPACTEACGPADRLPPLSVPAGTAAVGETLTLDLGVQRCWFSTCGLLWTNHNLSQFARLPGGEAVHSIVIVANMQIAAGGGQAVTSADGISLTVVGVPVVSSGATYALSPTAHLLFAHEFGHALGLLDEYGYEQGTAPDWEPPSNRNVWRPEEPAPFKNAGIPWGGSACGSGFHPCACGAPSPPNQCELCSNFVSAHCSYVPAVCQDHHNAGDPAIPDDCRPMIPQPEPDDLCMPAESLTFATAWEGAFYQREGYWRRRKTCQMEQLSPVGFCEACTQRIDAVLCEHASTACPTPALIATCPS
jgi:hypothetical protein